MNIDINLVLVLFLLLNYLILVLLMMLFRGRAEKAGKSPGRREKRKPDEDQLIRDLNHNNTLKRKEAATSLASGNSDTARLALEAALLKEQDLSVKIYISNALTDLKQESSLSVMMEALLDAPKWYRTKAISNILEFGTLYQPFFLEQENTCEIEWIELNLQYASLNFNDATKRYLFAFVDQFEWLEERIRENLEIQKRKQKNYRPEFLAMDLSRLLEWVCRTLANYYYKDFGSERYWNSSLESVKRNALWALAKRPNTDQFLTLLGILHDDEYETVAVDVLTSMVEKNPRLLYLLEEHFEEETDPRIRSSMAHVLSNRIEYYILQLLTKHGQQIENIIVETLRNGRINELVGFLNLNTNQDLENKLLELIAREVDPDSRIGQEFRTYLKEGAAGISIIFQGPSIPAMWAEPMKIWMILWPFGKALFSGTKRKADRNGRFPVRESYWTTGLMSSFWSRGRSTRGSSGWMLEEKKFPSKVPLRSPQAINHPLQHSIWN